MTKTAKKKQRAFTLLELLIVMIILALLAGLGLMAFGTIQKKSRDSRRKQDLINISKSLETYYNDWGTYPDSDNGAIVGCGPGTSLACNWGEPWLNTDNNTLYMSALPQDPVSDWNYFYLQNSDSSYYLFAYLENELDPDVAVDVNGDLSFYLNTDCDGSGLGCNYVIMSSNLISKPAIN